MKFPVLRHRLILFLLAAIFCFYVAENVYGYIFNNYLEQVQKIGTEARGWLELPRELPGALSVVAVSALFFCSEGVIAAVACFLLGFGLLAFTVPGLAGNYWLLCLWIMVASFGQHFFLVIVDAIVLHTAAPEKRSLRLGQMKALIMAAGLLASLFVWLKWKYVSRDYNIDFMLAAFFALLAGVIFVVMKPAGDFKPCTSWRDRVVVRKRYRLYYVLEAFFGARKQVFLTFGFWLLVSTLGKSATYMGQMMLISGVIGLGLRPLVGKMVQDWGERRALVTESVLVVVVCLGYALAMKLLPRDQAAVVLSACFVADASLFAFGMARASFLARIVSSRDDLTPSLYVGMGINHVTSIFGAVFGGVLWALTGDHMWVFLFAAVLGVIYGIFSARVPDGSID